MNGTELLHEAGALVATGWCQDANARTAEGGPIDVRSADAIAWSLLGALQAAACTDETTTIDDIASAVSAIAELILDPSLTHWNNDAGRTQRQVTDLLRRAEEIARHERNPPVALRVTH